MSELSKNPQKPSPKTPKLVGTFIRKRREVLKLSQRALGLLFVPPVTTQFISNVERGVTPLPPSHVQILTKALQVSEAELMALLETEYTLKLSGRLGLSQEMGDSPLTSREKGTPRLSVLSQDFDFIHNLYEAYKQADGKTRQAFVGSCQSILELGAPWAAGNSELQSN